MSDSHPQSDYPEQIQRFNPDDIAVLRRPPQVLSHAIAFGLGVAIVALGWVMSIKDSPPAPTPPTAPTFQISEIGGCQFLIFSNPFFVLHWPKCFAHTNAPAIEAP
jgi:hypothetical protein